MDLTRQEQIVLDGIRTFWDTYNRPPTYVELSSLLGVSSGYVGKYTSSLRDKGYLNKRRGIHLSDSQLLRPTEAAEQLGIARSTLGAWFAKGWIKTVRSPGGYHLVSQSEIDRILELRVLPKFGIDVYPDSNWCSWLVGFTDGEGTFSLTGNKKPGSQVPSYYTAKYQVFQRSDRRAIIEEISATLQCGTIIDRRAKGTTGPGSYLVVQDRPSLVNIIIPLFNKYPPRVKLHEYVLWRMAIMLMEDGARENINALHEIKEKLRYLYAYHEPENSHSSPSSCKP